jgi:hypothetical protein
MDGDRFDRAVRLFGVATTRRGALVTIAGIGGLLGGGGADAGHHRSHHKKTCKKGATPCGKQCCTADQVCFHRKCQSQPFGCTLQDNSCGLTETRCPDHPNREARCYVVSKGGKERPICLNAWTCEPPPCQSDADCAAPFEACLRLVNPGEGGKCCAFDAATHPACIDLDIPLKSPKPS